MLYPMKRVTIVLFDRFLCFYLSEEREEEEVSEEESSNSDDEKAVDIVW